MTLAPDLIALLAQYTTATKHGRVLIVTEEMPAEVIEKVKKLNEFYLENYGKEFIKI